MDTEKIDLGKKIVEKKKKFGGEGEENFRRRRLYEVGKEKKSMDAGEGIDRGDRERNCARRKNQYRLKVIQDIHKT